MMLTQRHRGTEQNKNNSSTGSNIERQRWQVLGCGINFTRRRGAAEKEVGVGHFIFSPVLSVPPCLCVSFSESRPPMNRGET